MIRPYSARRLMFLRAAVHPIRHLRWSFEAAMSGPQRLIDRGRGYFKTAFLLQMLDLEKGKCP